MDNKNIQTKTFIKKLTAILMVAVMLICAAPLSGVAELDFSAFTLSASAEGLAATGECGAEGDNVTWSFDSETGTLTISGVGAMAGSPFYNNSDIKTVIIESGVTSIGSYAFENCTSLTSVTIPDSVESIGSSAFYNCRNLESVTIPDSVTSIGDCAFDYVEKITVLNNSLDISQLPYNSIIWCYRNSAAHTYCVNNNRGYVLIDGTDEENKFSGTIGKFTWNLDKETGVLKISGAGALPSFGDAGAPWKEYNKYITTIEYAEGITALMSGHNSYSNLKTVIIPESVTSIGYKAFEYCIWLKSVTIPDSVTTIGDRAFSFCESLQSVTIPDSVTSIGNSAFYWCDSLQSVTIPNSVTTIGDDAFSWCDSLQSVTIPDSVTKIGSSAFYGCSALENLTIPYSVKKISNSALPGTLKEIYVYSKDCSFASDCGLNYTNTIYGFKGSTAEALADEIAATFIDIETVHTHKEEIIPGKAATCTEKGFTEGKICSEPVCSKVIVAQKIIPATGHKEETVAGKPATCTEAGITEGKKCTTCGTVTVAQETIPATGHTEATLKAVKSTYTKTGLTEGKKCTTCGKVTVKQKKVAKKKLKKVTVSSVKSTKAKTAAVSWKKTTDATGYIVEYSTSKKFTSKTTKKVTIKKGKTTKTTLKKLKSGKKYYVRVKAYRTEGKKTVYGSYSSVKTVKAK